MENSASPINGIHHALRLSSDGRLMNEVTPSTAAAARMPNASSAICTSPMTRRLDPEIICPAASSTVPVVRRPPGRKVMSGAMSTGSGSGISQTWASHRTISADPNAATMGNTSSRVADLTSFSRPTRIPRPNAIIAPVGVGNSSSTRPRVMMPCPSVRTIQPSRGRAAPISFRRSMPPRGRPRHREPLG